jgi:hypothetical protein
LSLLLLTAGLGAIVGLVVAFGRPFLPRKFAVPGWSLAGGAIGGAALIHPDGVDFTLLEPHWLAVAMFITIPALGAGAIAALIEALQRTWWVRRKTTALLALGAVPAVVTVVIPVVAALAAALCLAFRRAQRPAAFERWLPARVAALVVFVAATGAGLVGLGFRVNGVFD